MRHSRALVGASALVLLSSAAVADVDWDNPNGSGNFFSWENGRSTNGLFGSPQLIGGNTFLFSPSGFRAESENGATQDVGDTLIFDLHADQGFRITGVQIILAGNYTLTGDATADANASLNVDDIGGQNVRSEGGPMNFIPAPPFFGPGSDTFQGQTIADLSAGDPWTSVHIEFSANVIAISTPGSSARISLDSIGSQVAINIVPAPASALALLGLAGVTRRRR